VGSFIFHDLETSTPEERSKAAQGALDAVDALHSALSVDAQGNADFLKVIDALKQLLQGFNPEVLSVSCSCVCVCVWYPCV
jgi:hypothetical protein